MNFKGCFKCSVMELKEDERLEKIEEDKEHITYVHKCTSCDHVVANHRYSFTCTDTQHIYTMECELCGEGEDEKDWN